MRTAVTTTTTVTWWARSPASFPVRDISPNERWVNFSARLKSRTGRDRGSSSSCNARPPLLNRRTPPLPDQSATARRTRVLMRASWGWAQQRPLGQRGSKRLARAATARAGGVSETSTRTGTGTATPPPPRTALECLLPLQLHLRAHVHLRLSTASARAVCRRRNAHAADAHRLLLVDLMHIHSRLKSARHTVHSIQTHKDLTMDYTVDTAPIPKIFFSLTSQRIYPANWSENTVQCILVEIVWH